jgi:hypothetical protein
MWPKEQRESGPNDLFRARPDQIVDVSHSLARLVWGIDGRGSGARQPACDQAAAHLMSRHQVEDKRRRNVEMPRGGPPGTAGLHKSNHPLTQIQRISLWTSQIMVGPGSVNRNSAIRVRGTPSHLRLHRAGAR